MKTTARLSIVAAIFATLALAGDDPFSGTWKLNAQKSKYPPGACPRSMVIEMEPVANGVRYRSETTYPNGRKSKVHYTADYRGTEAIVRGEAGLLAPVSLERPDERTVVASYKRGMQVIATSRRVVSKNGRVMTITTTSPGPDGKPVSNTGVYDKVQPEALAALGR